MIHLSMNSSSYMTQFKANKPHLENHPIIENLQTYSKFYESWSYLIIKFVPLGTKAIFHFDTYIFGSMQATLDSISLLIQNGKTNDAYALLRKFHDLAMIDVYINLKLEQELANEASIVSDIQNWLEGKGSMPEFKPIRDYITQSSLQPIQAALSQFDYHNIRSRCNDHMHYNYFSNLLMNTETHNPKELELINTFMADIKYIVLQHISFMFYLLPHFMASSDYTDYMDMGMTPPEGCECEVAPFIHQMFTDLILQESPKIAELIKTSTGMRL